MGCITLYIFTNKQNETQLATEKWGSFYPSKPDELFEIISGLKDRKCSIDTLKEPFIGDWFCRGLYADIPKKQLHFYGCCEDYKQAQKQLEDALQHSHKWLNWNVAYAWDDAR